MEDINKNNNNHKKIFLGMAIILIIIVIAFVIPVLVIINSKSSPDLLNNEKLVTNEVVSNSANLDNNSISSDINKITAINYYSDFDNPTTYVIEEPEKIEKIVELFSKASWKDTTFTDKYHCSWYIKMEGNIKVEFFMQGIPVVKVKTNSNEKIYEIDEMEYKEILSEFNTRYYLHKSNLEKPKESKILKLREKIFKDLTNEEILEIQELTRWTHVHMEMQLLDSVNVIKDPKSPYWEKYNYGGIYTNPLLGAGTDMINCFNTKLEKLEKIKDIIKDEETKKEFENVIELLQKSMDNHDLEGCFKVHEFIHDYDYLAINYPAYFPTYPPPDWEGINVYFGHLKLN